MFNGKSNVDVNVHSVNGDSNNNVPKQNSYASMVKMDGIPKSLEFIPTVITETGNEVLIFDEEIVKKGSEKWCLTVCGQFVGYEMHINELSLGKPIVMDSMTASMCHKGIGNISYARVLVKMDAAKDLKNAIEIHYVDSSNNIKGSKKAQSNPPHPEVLTIGSERISALAEVEKGGEMVVGGGGLWWNGAGSGLSCVAAEYCPRALLHNTTAQDIRGRPLDVV
nr:RNA-directed DNA polymerase, eukaryota, reverse transcriptase zinc-binding domain protein [Tanacetum cinerariifolium]